MIFDMNNEKALLRKNMTEIRNNIPSDIKEKYDERLKFHTLNYIKNKKTKCVLCFASYRSEVDTISIVDELFRMGIIVCFPKVIGEDIEFFVVDSIDDLTEGYKGILEPNDKCPLYNPIGNEIILVPGLVFDTRLYRIGYGKGFYDRYFGIHYGLNKVGLAYSCQIIDKIPIDKWDHGLDLIITEKGEMSYG